MKLPIKLLSWIITCLLPLALTFLGLRLLLTHAFPNIEYNLPGFPEDIYGFSRQDRLTWSKLSIDYLLNDAGIDFLGDLTFMDGVSLFTHRELQHMQDVKNVVRPAVWVGYGTWLAMLILGLWAYFGGWWAGYVKGVKRGGWLTAALVGVLGVLGALSFWQFFTLFHKLFFTGDSWLFLYTDTLIRLFPMRFWQDAFLFVGLLDVIGGFALGIGLRPKPK